MLCEFYPKKRKCARKVQDKSFFFTLECSVHYAHRRPCVTSPRAKDVLSLSQHRADNNAYLTSIGCRFFWSNTNPNGRLRDWLDLLSPRRTTGLTPCFPLNLRTHDYSKINKNQVTTRHDFMYIGHYGYLPLLWLQFWERGRHWGLCQWGGSVSMQSSWNSFGCLK